MKEIDFLGTSLEAIKRFPLKAKRQVGHELDRVQRGQVPSDWKPMKSVGVGVQEIRVKDDPIKRENLKLHSHLMIEINSKIDEGRQTQKELAHGAGPVQNIM